MTAAELLRGLDKAATAGPWDYETHRRGDGLIHQIAPVKNALGQLDWSREVACTADGNEANARLIATTRNLLPLLAGLVEAVGRHEALMGMARRPGKQATMEAIMEARGGISAAYAALEAAAKEGA